MTPTELNVLRAQMAASIMAGHAERSADTAINRANEVLGSLGITADAPAPAEPAKPEPDFETLLRELVAEIDRGHPYLRVTEAYYTAVAAVAAVRP